MTDYQKGQRKIRSLIKRAIRERDTDGYRENLGYDQQNELANYLNGLGLTYPEHARLIQEFCIRCDKI